MRSTNQHRRGTLAPFLLFALTTLLGFFALAVNKGWLWSVREDLRTAADAAALAAAQDLVCDDMLRGDLNLLPGMLDRATKSAATYSAVNTVRSHRLELRENVDNPRAGDVLFGVLTTPRAGDFVPVANRTKAESEQARTNTVVIVGRQSHHRGTAQGLTFGAFFGRTYADVAVTSAATLDRGVRGFRPINEPTPLAPLTLFSDPSGADPKSWEFAVEARNGADTFGLDSQTNTYVAGTGNGIREFTVSLPTDADNLSTANAALAHIGTSDVTALAAHLTTGYTALDLSAYGGKFVLPANDSSKIEGQNVGPAGDSAEIQALYQALEGLRQSATVRIWPLYTEATSDEVTISGFVAARVVAVTQPVAKQPLQVTLKATMIHRTDALTDTDLRGSAATMNGNAYICKIRRIE
jgi:Putative Flp pilus-assembly TadE/G-like